MPQYKVTCATCGMHETRRLTFAAYDAAMNGSSPLACGCGAQAAIEFDPAAVSFVLKDGPSGGFISKAAKENAYRAGRRRQMGQRQRDHVNPNRLVPNYRGQVASSWTEAQRAAYESTYERVKGEGTGEAGAVAAEVARTYDPLVKREAS